jgi:hypothetical protein
MFNSIKELAVARTNSVPLHSNAESPPNPGHVKNLSIGPVKKRTGIEAPLLPEKFTQLKLEKG